MQKIVAMHVRELLPRIGTLIQPVLSRCKNLRQVPLFILLVLGGIALLPWAREFIGKILALGMLSYLLGRMVWTLMKRILELWPVVWRRFVRKCWRFAVNVRRFYSTPAEVEFLHLVTILFASISLCYLLLTQDAAGFEIFNYGIAGVLMLGATIDLIRRISWLLRTAWARAIGKVLLAGTGALMVYLATSIVKHGVHSAVHVDPQNFNEFVGLASVVLTPFLYLLFLMAAAIALAALELTALMILVGVIRSVGGRVMEATKGVDAYRRVLYRIQTGKKTATDIENPRYKLGGMVLIMRPFALLFTLAVLIWWIAQLSNDYSKILDKAFVKTLVLMEYRSGSSCSNLRSQDRVAYLEKGAYVSIVEDSAGEPVFTVRKCDRTVTLPSH